MKVYPHTRECIETPLLRGNLNPVVSPSYEGGVYRNISHYTAQHFRHVSPHTRGVYRNYHAKSTSRRYFVSPYTRGVYRNSIPSFLSAFETSLPSIQGGVYRNVV